MRNQRAFQTVENIVDLKSKILPIFLDILYSRNMLPQISSSILPIMWNTKIRQMFGLSHFMLLYIGSKEAVYPMILIVGASLWAIQVLSVLFLT